MSLERFGWSAEYDQDFAPFHAQGLEPARVTQQQRGAYVVVTAAGERPAEPAGSLRHEGELPVTGDWVAVRPGESVTIRAVLPRRSAFVRKAAGDDLEQVVAANLDVAFLVDSLLDANVRRLERYLATAWQSGAEPVVVLTKRDLAEDVESALFPVEAIAFGAPVHAISSVTGEGVDDLRAYIVPNRTAALLGVSGAGKSSLVNRLLGEERQAVAGLRSDGRGRHTTTHRELVPLPGGGLVLDTPGMRELGLWAADAGVQEAFDDVAELALRCRFNDCSHESEPGCAVRAALEDGRLTSDRLASYRNLVRELAFQERRRDPRLQAAERARWKKINRDFRGGSRER